MNDTPTCPRCGSTWNDMYDIRASLRVGELKIKSLRVTTCGVDVKLECCIKKKNKRKTCESGELIIPLITDIFNSHWRWVYLTDTREENVHIPLYELTEKHT